MSDFIPLFGFRSGHRQTILGHFARKWLPRPVGALRRVALADGDVLHTYDTVPDAWKPNAPVVLIVHGLGGSHVSGSVIRLTWECLHQHWRVLRINLRGCGGSMPDTRKPYHAGCSADILAVVRAAHEWYPHAPLLLVGISLGGNIVLKLAGEVTPADVPALGKILAVAPPVDLQHCSNLLELPHNAMYQRTFVTELTRLARLRAREHGETLHAFPKKMKLSEFDHEYTAPRVGYASVTEYYARASSLPLLGAIRVPTHILAAADDPFVAAEPLLQAKPSSAVRLQVTQHGGHLGYVARPRRGGWCWLEREVVRHLR
jgi:predicted alpha/beta-fold hydrolase